MTGETALVEVTSSKIASNITNAEIDGLPSQGRNQLSLMQLVPGLTPNLKSRIVCGRSVRRANGQATTANLFLVDGAYDNDDRRGGSQGTQARHPLCHGRIPSAGGAVHIPATNAVIRANHAPIRVASRFGWAFSVGMKQQIGADVAVPADYVGNRGRDQVTLIDINEGPPGANGRITRLGVNGFDPNGELIPASARSTNFLHVLQYQSLDALNTDYNALELALEKRTSQRWSGRVSYTLARARDVGAITDDRNPRGDYGRTSFDNRHALAISSNFSVWRGLGAGLVFRYYSGYPINETIGSDSVSFARHQRRRRCQRSAGARPERRDATDATPMAGSRRVLCWNVHRPSASPSAGPQPR